LNLAVNAREAMPKGGRLDISLRAVVLSQNTASGHADAPTRANEAADSGVLAERRRGSTDDARA